MSANMAARCWSGDQAVGLGSRPLMDGWILWHEPDWRADVHCCRSLKKKKKKKKQKKKSLVWLDIDKKKNNQQTTKNKQTKKNNPKQNKQTNKQEKTNKPQTNKYGQSRGLVLVLLLSRWMTNKWANWDSLERKVHCLYLLLSWCCIFFQYRNRLTGLVVKALASRAEVSGFESCLRWNFSRSSHTSGLKIGTRVATLPDAWRYRAWLARCQYPVTGWGSKFDLQLLSQCGSTYICLSRSVSEIH